MINCLTYYLQHGLVDFKHKNLENRKLINETSHEFLEWIKETDEITEGNRINKNLVYDKFIEENKDFKQWLKQKRFTQWIQKYCEFYNKEYTEGNSNGTRWFEINSIVKQIDPTPPPPEDDFTPINEAPF
jgi:hypothetical protein